MGEQPCPLGGRGRTRPGRVTPRGRRPVPGRWCRSCSGSARELARAAYDERLDVVAAHGQPRRLEQRRPVGEVAGLALGFAQVGQHLWPRWSERRRLQPQSRATLVPPDRLLGGAGDRLLGGPTRVTGPAPSSRPGGALATRSPGDSRRRGTPVRRPRPSSRSARTSNTLRCRQQPPRGTMPS